MMIVHQEADPLLGLNANSNAFVFSGLFALGVSGSLDAFRAKRRGLVRV